MEKHENYFLVQTIARNNKTSAYVNSDVVVLSLCGNITDIHDKKLLVTDENNSIARAPAIDHVARTKILHTFKSARHIADMRRLYADTMLKVKIDTIDWYEVFSLLLCLNTIYYSAALSISTINFSSTAFLVLHVVKRLTL